MLVATPGLYQLCLAFLLPLLKSTSAQCSPLWEMPPVFLPTPYLLRVGGRQLLSTQADQRACESHVSPHVIRHEALYIKGGHIFQNEMWLLCIWRLPSGSPVCPQHQASVDSEQLPGSDCIMGDRAVAWECPRAH